MSRPAALSDPARDLQRRRRLVDMARLLPLFGVLVLILPLVWQPAERGEAVIVPLGAFLFGSWLVLIAAAFLLTRALGPSTADPVPEDVSLLAADPAAIEAPGRQPGPGTAGKARASRGGADPV